MTYQQFSRQIFAVISAIQDSLEKPHPRMDFSVPADWPETQALLQSVAADLMLCADIPSTVAKLKEDQAKLLISVWMTTEVEDAYLLQTIQRAYESTPEATEIFPGQPFAAYLLEVSKGPAPVWRKQE